MVGVAQLVEHLVVAQVAVGSSPITHPIGIQRPLQPSVAAAFLFALGIVADKPSGSVSIRYSAGAIHVDINTGE
jgi:hypothetical protein